MFGLRLFRRGNEGEARLYAPEFTSHSEEITVTVEQN